MTPFMKSTTPEPTHQVVACLGGKRTRIETRSRPVPGPGEILLRMRVSGLCGTDLFKLQTGSILAGQVLGHEIVGDVEALGEEVEKFQVGQRVVVPHHIPCGECPLCLRDSHTMCRTFKENLLEPGGFAEFVLVRARAAALGARRVPESLSDEATVFLEPAACVLRGIHRSLLGPEGLAVVQGAGSMGLLHVLVLRAILPRVQVLAVDPVMDRQRLAEQLGAHRSSAPGGETASAVQELSNGMGADAIFDTVGGAGPLREALGLSREGGSVVLFAHAAAGETADFDLNHLFKYERRVLGTYSAGLEEQGEIFQALESGRLDPSPLVTHRLPLEEFDRAVEILENRAGLKILLYPSNSIQSRGTS